MFKHYFFNRLQKKQNNREEAAEGGRNLWLTFFGQQRNYFRFLFAHRFNLSIFA